MDQGDKGLPVPTAGCAGWRRRLPWVLRGRVRVCVVTQADVQSRPSRRTHKQSRWGDACACQGRRQSGGVAKIWRKPTTNSQGLAWAAALFVPDIPAVVGPRCRHSSFPCLSPDGSPSPLGAGEPQHAPPTSGKVGWLGSVTTTQNHVRNPTRGPTWACAGVLSARATVTRCPLPPPSAPLLVLLALQPPALPART